MSKAHKAAHSEPRPFWKMLLTFDKRKLERSTGNIGDVLAKKEQQAQHQRELDEEKKRKAEAEEQRKLLLQADKEAKAKKTVAAEARTEEPALPKRRKPKRRRRSVRELFMLAGVEQEPKEVYKKIFLYAIITNLALTLLALGIEFFIDRTITTLQAIWSVAGFAAAMWTFGLLFFLILYGAFYAVYLDLRINKRRKEVEAVFPDYLQLAAANLSAGMTIDKALWGAVRPRFGVLSKEIEEVAKKTMTGYDLERALLEFSAKYDSITIKRSVSLIVEGIRTGGQMAEILNKIAINMQENAILQKEMAANVTTYTIFISFATVLAAPFLFGLSAQLLLVIKSIAGTIGDSSSSGVGLSINADVISMEDFRIFAVVVLTVSSVMSACIVSVIRKGSVKDGLRLVPFFWIATVALFFLSTWILGFMFGGLA